MNITMGLPVILNIAVVAMAAHGELKPLPSGRLDAAVSANTPAGRILVPAREMLLEGTYPSGKPIRGNLMVLFEPSVGYYGWMCSVYWAPPEYVGVPGRLPVHKLYMVDFIGSSAGSVYVDRDRIVAFAMTGPLDLVARESNAKAFDLNDAETKSLQEATAQLQAMEGNHWFGWKSVPLFKQLGHDFRSPKDSAAIGPGPKFIEVSRKDGNWEVVLEGQWKERITINDKYELVQLDRLK